MNQTLTLALAIIALGALGIIFTGNPMFAMVLLLLPQLPYGLAQEQMRMDAFSGDDDDEANPIGFTAELKKR